MILAAAEDLEKKGLQAFVDEDFEEAVNLYTDAIELESSNAALYSSRSAAHAKLENYTDAVADANKAIALNPKLSKGYLRKGMACFYLEEYQTAKAAFVAGAALDLKSSAFKTWISKCDAKLRDEEDGVVEGSRSSSVPVTNDDTQEVATPMDTVTQVENTQVKPPSAPEPVKEEPSPAAVPESAPPPPAAPKYRHEWYQTLTHVTVSVFAKGIKGEDLQVDYGEQLLSVIINSGDEEPYVFQLRLFGKVIPAQCKHTLLRTKIEVKLTKAEPMQWKQLEFDPKPQAVVKTLVDLKDVEEKAKYPTSSKKPAKNWDKLEAEVKKEEKDEKLEGDAALNKLFRDIYGNADEDTRRAMNKSFVESNGTVLSTNWKDVGKKKIEGSAPTGMEMKKWET